MHKRILIFSLAYYPNYVSGAEAAIKEITDRIDTRDIKFELLTLWFDRSQPKDELIGNVLVHRIGIGPQYLSKMLFIPMAAWRARAIHKQEPLQGMWAMMTYMLFPTVLARFLGVHVPYVITLQDGDPYDKVFERWFIRPLAWLLDYGFRHAAVVQAISSYLAEWPKRRGASVPIEIIYNGGNPGDFAASFKEEELSALRKEIGYKEGDVWLLSPSRLAHKNAVDDIIRALALLPKHVKLLVVGGGSEEDMLRDLVRTEQLEERVHFTGQVPRTEMPKYRKIADIAVRASRSEGLGNALLSSMAAKIPVIATQEGGLAEFIFDVQRNPDRLTTAWAVDPDSPDQIAAAVEDILAHPELVKEVTQNAYEMVVKYYQWDTIARDMQEKIFSRLNTHTS